MDEYIKKSDLKDELLRRDFFPAIVKKALEAVPTADVVSREELDRLHSILDYYALQYGTVKSQQEVIDRVKRETAMEIFAEIKNMCSLHHEFNGTHIVAHIDFQKLAELKKKYTEDKK